LSVPTTLSRPFVEKASITARVMNPSMAGSCVRLWKIGTAMVLMCDGSVPRTV
jgi:prepilin-type processing-associated H-X9-DG protein